MAKIAIDGPRLEAFMGQAVVDLAAAFSTPLVRLGARLGLYRALAEGGPATPHLRVAPEELAHDRIRSVKGG